ncbi:HTH-type transcriptional regulator MalT [Volucribacter amazonae]|uniref:HTH-type transcriptional regulator MalT n=1 Tax=Volucribacter amazonae TaxID=256731 RepID=A0A9X4P9S7_9PAST|nr:HTH-type transcriptional regulator MalT [Volucribacter amazonae]MDG6895128.1 transcriptional regulator MalT [Volucribacter amazonae]
MLIPSKLTPSFRLQNSIVRQRLLQLLDNAAQYPLVLMNAPAGYGKTTLISQWIKDKSTYHIGWYALDESDNQTERFATYFSTALFNAMGLEPTISEHNQNEYKANLQLLFDQLLVSVSHFDHHLYLIIDDYHLIENEQIHEGLKYWLKHQPQNMTLILLSRSTPPLGIASLRVQELLLEIDIHQLCFDHQETIHFFKQKVDPNLASTEIISLCDEVEGWVTALQLISLATKQHNISLQEATQRFTRLSSHISEYLNDEVLNQIDKDTRHFLLQCSVLRSMNEQLVQHLTGVADSRRKLEELEKQGLFIQQIEAEHHWWRFHPLFASFLWQCCQTELADQLPLLHQRASESWLALGYSTEALYHAMQLQDHKMLLRILQQYAWQLFHFGEFKLLEQCLAKLDDNTLVYHANLVLLKAWLAQSQHRHNEVNEIFSHFDQVFSQYNVALTSSNQAEFDVLRAQVAINEGDEDKALRLASQALAQLPADFYYAQTVATSIIGEAHHVRGELNIALQWLQKAEQMSYRHHTYHNLLWSLLQQAEILLAQGFLQVSYDMLNKANQLVQENHLQNVPMYEFLLRTKARILWEWYKLDKAESMAIAGLEILNQPDQLQCRVLLSKISLVKGDLDNATRIIKQIEDFHHSRRYHSDWQANFDSARLLLWQMNNDVLACQNWLLHSWQPAHYHNHFNQEQGRNLARANLLIGNIQQAELLLNQLIEITRKLHLTSDLNRALILRNRCFFLQNKTALAQQDLIEALNLIRQTNFISAFVVEGDLMAIQIRQLLQLRVLDELVLPKAQFILRNINQYYRHKFAHFDENFVKQLLNNPQVPELLKISPLTQREWQVLGLIYSGYSNEQIASELQVATTTTKTHIRNLYQKIGVNNRTEAIEYTKNLLQIMGYK